MKYKIKIKDFYGVGSKEFEEKRHNIWIGVSLSNKAFVPELVIEMVTWALLHTKEKVLVLIPGRMQATNYRYFENLRRSDALKKAFKEEDDWRLLLEKQNFPKNVEILNYDGVCSAQHIRQRECFFREFARQEDFYQAVIAIVSDTIKKRGRTVDIQKIESLALYVLHELPFFVDGIGKIDEKFIYTLCIYPGKDVIDDLAEDIREGQKFPKLTELLKIKNKTGLVDIVFE